METRQKRKYNMTNRRNGKQTSKVPEGATQSLKNIRLGELRLEVDPQHLKEYQEQLVDERQQVIESQFRKDVLTPFENHLELLIKQYVKSGGFLPNLNSEEITKLSVKYSSKLTEFKLLPGSEYGLKNHISNMVLMDWATSRILKLEKEISVLKSTNQIKMVNSSPELPIAIVEPNQFAE